MKQDIGLILLSVILSSCNSEVGYDYALKNKLVLYPESIELIVGENSNIAVGPESDSHYHLDWTSSDPFVVTVDNRGNVFSHKSGYAIVSATTNKGKGYCKVSVKERTSFWLKGIHNAYSDMIWIDDCLVGFVPSADDYSKSGYIEIVEFANSYFSEPTNSYRIYHLWGHCNSVDYNSETDCLIMGNGSGDYNLPGKIIIIPCFKSLIRIQNGSSNPYSLQDVKALIIDCEEYKWGAKYNLVWGNDNGNEEDLAFLITATLHALPSQNGGDMATIRKIGLCKGDRIGRYGHRVPNNNTVYNGTFNVIEVFTQDTEGYKNCNQGTCYHQGELIAAIGHDGFWYWRMFFENGRIYKKTYKSKPSSDALFDGNASGIAIMDDYFFVGCANNGIIAIHF